MPWQRFVPTLAWVTALGCSHSSPHTPAPATGGAGSGPTAGGAPAGAGAPAGGAHDQAGTTPSGGGGVTGSTGSGGVAGQGGVVGGPFGHPDPAVTHPSYEGFTLWVVEDFTAPLDFATDPIWTYSDGGFQTHRFTKEAISFEAGKMVLTLSEQEQPASCSFSNTGVVPVRTRTSGELRSKHNWFRYGRYETRLKVPSVKPNDAVTNGNYIASLFTYRQPACQEWREIDLEVTGDSAHHLGTNLITANQDCNFTADKEQPEFFDLPGNFRTEFQTIGFEWLPGVIKFYYLDQQGALVPLRELASEKVPDLSAKIMANLWVFGDSFDFGGPEGANNVYPMRAEYDFVRFYKWDMDDAYPCADMAAACLKETDLDLTSNNACDGVPHRGDPASCAQCGTTVRMACTETCQ